MYASFYQLVAPPFETTPDPRFYYASEQHREALAAIEYTIKMRKGIVLITGSIGSGKTTVGRTMLERCGDQAAFVQIAHGHTRASELLRHVLRRLETSPSVDDDHAMLLEQLESVLIAHTRRGRPVVLFVDEAQTLSDETLEELRLISNYDINGRRLLQLILVGQPELRDRIAEPRFSALRQRIVMSKRLSPLSHADTAGYIRHRMAVASREPRRPGVIFNPDAVRAIFEFSRGVPRLINVTCDNCLLLGFVKQARRITPEMVGRVVDDMAPGFSTPYCFAEAA